MRTNIKSVMFLFKAPVQYSQPLIQPDFCGLLVTGLTGSTVLKWLIDDDDHVMCNDDYDDDDE